MNNFRRVNSLSKDQNKDIQCPVVADRCLSDKNDNCSFRDSCFIDNCKKDAPCKVDSCIIDVCGVPIIF